MSAQPTHSARRSAVLGFLLITGVHYFILSAGGVWPLPSYSAYHSRLAEAFRVGQTHLILKPTPGLLALPDPYDPVANRPFRKGLGVHDAVLFHGKFYLYWGPTPALLLSVAKSFGVPTVVGDEWLVLAFTLGTNVWVTLLILRLWRLYFSSRSPTLVLLGIAIYGLGTPLTFFLARPAVYEASIAGGQFFLLAGVALAWRTRHANDETSPLPAYRARGPHIRLLLAGICLSLAVGSRASLAIAVVGIAIAVSLGLIRSQNRSRANVAKALLSFSLPLFAGAGLLLAYNHARFNAVLEFGQKYQLTGANYNATPALFSSSNFLPSVWSYGVRPVAFTRTFPFVLARVGEGTFPSWITRPAHYESQEQIVGLLVATPIILLSLLPIVGLLRNTISPLMRQPILLLLLAGGLGFGPALFMIGTTERYLMDLWPSAAILSAVGVWQAVALARTRALRWVLAALIAWGMVVALFLGFTGYYEHFRNWNPEISIVDCRTSNVEGKTLSLADNRHSTVDIRRF